MPEQEYSLSLGWNGNLNGESVIIPAGTYLITTHIYTQSTEPGVLLCTSSITPRVTGGAKTADYWEMSNTAIAIISQATEVKYSIYNTCEAGVKVSIGLEALRVA